MKVYFWHSSQNIKANVEQLVCLMAYMLYVWSFLKKNKRKSNKLNK